jgi:hypothetical protein
MIELVWHGNTSIRERVFMIVKIRAGSRFKQFLCFALIDVRCSRIPQVEDHWFRAISVQ